MPNSLIIIICIVFFGFNSLSANTDTLSMFKELKILIEQNGKKIEQNFIMIKQLEKRLDFMQNLIYVILGAVVGLLLYLSAKRERYDRDVHDKVKNIIVVLRKLAQDDLKVSRSLKVAGII